MRWVLTAALLLIVTQIAWAAEAKNVILFISDGGGFNCYRAASYYQHGMLGRQPYDQSEWVKHACCTYPLTRSGHATASSKQDENIIYDPDKIWDGRYEAVVDRNGKPPGTGPFKGYNFLKKTPTDSAAAGTALATGVKTYNGAINFAKASDSTRPLRGKSVAEIAKSLGKSAGVVSSVPWSHATPATLGGAHNIDRSNYYNIANEMLNNERLDVIMGGGNPEYDANGAPRVPGRESDFNYVGGSFTWERLRAGTHSKGWTLVETKAQFEALMTGPAPAKVVGTAQVAQTLQQQRRTRDWDGDGYVDDADVRVAPAYGDPPITTVPSLATMAKGALNVLSRNESGFFLMVEGGAVDWANHANQAGRMIEEMIEFNEAIRAAVDWVEANSNWDETLIIITSDHETGMLWGANSDKFAFEPVLNRGAGRMPGLWYNCRDHTNSLVPLRARGPGSELFASLVVGGDPVYGDYVENTSVFAVMKAALSGSPLRRDADRSNGKSANGQGLNGSTAEIEKPATRQSGNGSHEASEEGSGNVDEQD